METITSLAVLQALPAQEAENYGVYRTFSADQLIFRQGDPTTGLWAVVGGRVAIERGDASGRVVIVAVWQHEIIPVSIAGLRDGAPYVASCRALDADTRTWWAPREHVLRWMAQAPGFAEQLCWYVADRFRYIQALDGDTRGRPLAGQLAVILSTLARRFGPDITLTHEELAHMVGAQRETVTRVLAHFARRGWIDSRYGRILVRDLAGLTEETGESPLSPASSAAWDA
jgi:CRP/FNR family cyclic AMP-dependent transcriptional regulator